MNDHKIRDTDLNLLVTLSALLETHNVSRAAKQLGLSQPAVSHALNRLRDTFNDPLLVRSGRSMVPTSRAEELLPQVREVLADIESLLKPNQPFQPDVTNRSFVLAVNGYSSQLLVPRILERLQGEAPHANLRVVPTGHHNLRDLLGDGRVDVGLISGSKDMLPDALMMRSLFDDPFAVVMREGHPLAKGVTMEEYASASHILVSPRGDAYGVVDSALSGFELERRIALVMPDFMSVPKILRESDLIITTPISIAKILDAENGLVQVPAPTSLGLEQGALITLWHERVQNDPVNQWFRRLIVEVGQEFESELKS